MAEISNIRLVLGLETTIEDYGPAIGEYVHCCGGCNEEIFFYIDAQDNIVCAACHTIQRF